MKIARAIATRGRFARGGNESVTFSPTRIANMVRAPLRRERRAEHHMGMPAESKRRWHADDARALQREDRAWPRYEVIDGELLVTPAPMFRHQYAIGELHLELGNYLRQNREAQVWLSPADIQLEPDTTIQPDIFVTPRIRPISSWASFRSLLLAIEVLSPSSLKQDRTIKRRFYQRHGVPEYWVVDVEARHVERWRPGDTEAQIVRDRIEWRAPGATAPLVIEPAPIFAECAAIAGET
jgi:Uma2 family endonuclease